MNFETGDTVLLEVKIKYGTFKSQIEILYEEEMLSLEHKGNPAHPGNFVLKTIAITFSPIDKKDEKIIDGFARVCQKREIKLNGHILLNGQFSFDIDKSQVNTYVLTHSFRRKNRRSV